MNKKIFSNTIFMISIVLVSVLILFKDIFVSNILAYISLIFIILLFFLLNKTQSTLLFFYTLPLSTGLPQNYLFLGYLLSLVFHNNGKLYFSRLIFIPIIVLILELLHFIIPPFSISDYVAFVVYFVIFCIFGLEIIRTNTQNYYSYIRAFLFGFIFGTFLVFLQIIDLWGISEMLARGIRLGTNTIDSNGFLTNLGPNGIALYSIFLISALLIMPLFKKRIINYLLILVLTFIGVLTLSRNFIFSFIVLLFLYLILHKRIRILFYIVILAGFLYFIDYFLMGNVLDNYLNRFIGVEDLSSGRIDILRQYISYFFTNPRNLLFGVGMQDYVSKLGATQSIHTSLIEAFVYWGIFGGAVYYLMIFLIFWKNFKRSSRRIVTAIPLMIFIFSTLFIRILSTPVTLIIFSLVLVTFEKNNISNETNIKTYKKEVFK